MSLNQDLKRVLGSAKPKSAQQRIKDTPLANVERFLKKHNRPEQGLWKRQESLRGFHTNTERWNMMKEVAHAIYDCYRLGLVTMEEIETQTNIDYEHIWSGDRCNEKRQSRHDMLSEVLWLISQWPNP